VQKGIGQADTVPYSSAGSSMEWICSANPIHAKMASGRHPHHIIRDLTSEAAMGHLHEQGRIRLPARDGL